MEIFEAPRKYSSVTGPRDDSNYYADSEMYDVFLGFFIEAFKIYKLYLTDSCQQPDLRWNVNAVVLMMMMMMMIIIILTRM